MKKHINNVKYTLPGWTLRLNYSFGKYELAKLIPKIMNGGHCVICYTVKFSMYSVYGRGKTFALSKGLFCKCQSIDWSISSSNNFQCFSIIIM